MKRQLPRWKVVGYVGYAKYVAYLGTYDEYVSGLHGNSSKAENRGEERS